MRSIGGLSSFVAGLIVKAWLVIVQGQVLAILEVDSLLILSYGFAAVVAVGHSLKEIDSRSAITAPISPLLIDLDILIDSK